MLFYELYYILMFNENENTQFQITSCLTHKPNFEVSAKFGLKVSKILIQLAFNIVYNNKIAISTTALTTIHAP